MIRGGLPADAIRLLTCSADDQRAAIAEQAEAGRVSARATRSLRSARKELESLRIDHLLSALPEGRRGLSLAAALDLAGVKAAKARNAVIKACKGS